MLQMLGHNKKNAANYLAAFFLSNNEFIFYSFTSLKSLNLPLLVAVNFRM